VQAINRTAFFDHYRETWGPLTQGQVDGIEAILTAMEADTALTDIRWAAYMLGTVKRECGDEWKPIREYDRGHGRPYGIKDTETGHTYYGRGFVQLTWKGNYATMGKALGVDLLYNPDLALDPTVAYRIMSYGMRNGSFTGVGLKKYINAEKCDYLNARRIINGLDCSKMIAGYATVLEAALRG